MATESGFIVRADEMLTAFLEAELAIPQIAVNLMLEPDDGFGVRNRRVAKIVLTRGVAACQSRTRVKSVRHLPQELHLTLFPQG